MDVQTSPVYVPSVIQPRPAAPQRPQPWFELAVQTIVKQASSKPFLLLVSALGGLRFHTMDVTAEEAAAGWPLLASTIEATGADTVILVQPVNNSIDVCASARGGGPCSMRDAAADMQSSSRVSVSGRIGDCCDGDGSESSSQPHEHPATSSQQPLGSVPEVEHAFFGMVVQSRSSTQLQGCYLLKRSRTLHQSSLGTGCSCTHYSLNRVCSGVPLWKQWQDSWLV